MAPDRGGPVSLSAAVELNSLDGSGPDVRSRRVKDNASILLF